MKATKRRNYILHRSRKCQNDASRNQTLTFSHQEGLRDVTAAAVTGSAGVATAVLLLHSLDRQRSVVLAQNHTWKPIGMVVLTGHLGRTFAMNEKPAGPPHPSPPPP